MENYKIELYLRNLTPEAKDQIIFFLLQGGNKEFIEKQIEEFYKMYTFGGDNHE